jgi:hypothetical protein
MKKTRVMLNVIYAALSVGLIVVQVRKDLLTHSGHEEHNPCECNKQCLRCAF